MPSERPSPADLRRWVRGHQAAERRIAADRRGQPIDSDAALGRALELMQLVEELHGDAGDPETPTEEDLRVYDVWVRLRAALRGRA